MRRSRASAASLMVVLSALAAGTARAQDVRYVEEPTGGVNLPTAGLAGEQDALSVVVNPAGMMFLEGLNIAAAIDFGREEDATTAGTGGGLYIARLFGGGVLPRVGFGLGVEFLRPPRVVLDPDPGEPTRLTSAMSVGLGKTTALGVSWHHYFDDDGRLLDAADTFDIGFSVRAGAHWAAGLAVRDVNAPTLQGIPVQRRYEAELVNRPIGTDRLELAIGGRLGERRTDVDGWLRGAVKIVRGLYLRAEFLTLELHEIDVGISETATDDRRDYRITAGLEVSLGNIGITPYASAAFDDDGDGRMRGGTVVLRMSQRPVPSIMPTGKRIEKLDLGGGVGAKTLTGTIAHLRRLGEDDDVVAVFIQLDGFAAGWATTNELRTELAKLRRAGKKVFAYIAMSDTRQYYLASVADKIWVDAAGAMRLQGIVATSIYFKRLFDFLGVEAQFEKIEEYKSAPEQFTRTSPSEPALAMRNELFDDLYDRVIAGVAEGRRISKSRVKALIDGGPYTAGDLEKLPDLVDAVVEPDQLDRLITEELGRAYPVGAAPSERDERWEYPAIAVVYIGGDIVDGKSRKIPVLGRELVGGETIARAIATARADPRVKAIILRIDSPGGSAMASEVMAREVFRTRGKKPILCSLGDVAASGGYFAAAGCDKILADPMTITGSIGIFNGKFDLSRLLGRLGVDWSTFKRGKNADAETYFRPFTDEERAELKRMLHYYYGRFLKAVAEGRDMTTEQVDEVGRGRVWTGAQAKSHKLVDEFGGISDAIDQAKRAAGMSLDEKAQIMMLPQEDESLLRRLLGGVPGIGREGEAGAMSISLNDLVPGGAEIDLAGLFPASLWVSPGSIQARLPFAIVWH